MFTYSSDYRDVRLQQKLSEIAKRFRKNPTKAEKIMWRYLKDKELFSEKFRRQHPLYQFIVDFYCHSKKLIIEIDGEIHQYTFVRDQARDKLFQDHGYHILRFTNEEVFFQIDQVLAKIHEAISSEERDARRAG